jgi:hypothetical protein
LITPTPGGRPQIGGESSLTRDEYGACVADLMRELRLVRSASGEGGSGKEMPAEEHHLRMMMVGAGGLECRLMMRGTRRWGEHRLLRMAVVGALCSAWGASLGGGGI